MEVSRRTFTTLFALLTLAVCGCGVRAPVPGPPPEPELPNEIPMGTPGDFDEADVNGPFEPPAFPPTVYEPYVRRSVVPAPALPAASNTCHLAVEVVNYDGTDGCGLLLVTDGGNLLAVGATPRGEPLEAGTRLVIGFEYMEDMTGSTCQNADAVVRILCRKLVRVSSGVPRPVYCEAYDTPAKWLVDLARGYTATAITRFPWTDDRYVYLVETPDGQYLYDCRGFLICKPRKNCLGFIDDIRQGKLIWEN